MKTKNPSVRKQKGSEVFKSVELAALSGQVRSAAHEVGQQLGRKGADATERGLGPGRGSRAALREMTSLYLRVTHIYLQLYCSTITSNIVRFFKGLPFGFRARCAAEVGGDVEEAGRAAASRTPS